VSEKTAEAYARLRHAIVRLELAPGAGVSEAQLVSEFGLSKAAVRAALARLRAEGLVVAEPRRAHVVAPITLRDVLEIYELRLLLEPASAEGAAGRMESEEIRRLQALAEPAVDDIETFLSANRAIHLAITEAAGNRRTARILERLLDDTERVRLVALRAGAASGGVRARQELRAVLAEIEAKNGAGARELMAETIRGFRDELVESLQRAVLDMPLP
jgi:DNA-binding GntR family transcriptional regulator